MELIAQRREARRLKALRDKAALHEERKQHGDDLAGVRFTRMVEAERHGLLTQPPAHLPSTKPHGRGGEGHGDGPRVAVMVRKRPLGVKEMALKAVDVVTCLDGGHMVVHEPKTKVDLSRHVESLAFSFDDAFDEAATNAEVYASAVAPLVKLCLGGGGANATCFAYGQTGSGKTHTMTSCYLQVAEELMAGAAAAGLGVWVSFYDIYAGKCFDLLSNRKPLQALEDARGQVQLVGLKETRTDTPEEVLALVETGVACRKTSRTDSNAASSRSHSIFQMVLRPAPPAADATSEEPKPPPLAADQASSSPTWAKLSLVDLAGSERGADRGKLVDQRIRREGAEINKSLLALKECIRALSAASGYGGMNNVAPLEGGGGEHGLPANGAGDLGWGGERGSDHVPFRGSKLTQVLRDAFIGKRSRTVLLAHISPAHGCAEHTLNTLRYALRLKDGLESGPVATRAVGSGLGGTGGAPSISAPFGTVAGERAARAAPLIGDPARGLAALKRDFGGKMNMDISSGDGLTERRGAGESDDRPSSSQAALTGVMETSVAPPKHPEDWVTFDAVETTAPDAAGLVGALPATPPMKHHAAIAAAATVEEDEEADEEALQEAYRAAKQAATRAGEALMAAHLLYAEVVKEEQGMIAAATATVAAAADANANGDTSHPLVYYDYCDDLEGVLERRAALEKELRAAAAELRRAQAEEEAAAADLDSAEWGASMRRNPLNGA